MVDKKALIAFAFNIGAGMATIIGALVLVPKQVKNINKAYLSYINAFAAGVMLFVSLCEILQVKSYEGIRDYYCPYDDKCHSDNYAKVLAISYALFFAGAVFCAGISKLVHHIMHKTGYFEESAVEKSKERLEEGETLPHSDKPRVMVAGLTSFLALLIHNIPEGIVTFIAAYKESETGAVLALAVAIHNIPEGIAVALPIYYATLSKKKALFFVTVAGLSEPVGGLIGFGLVKIFGKYETGQKLFEGISFAVAAGIMMWVVIVEMIPLSIKHAKNPMYLGFFFFSGCLVMAVSLVLLNVSL